MDTNHEPADASSPTSAPARRIRRIRGFWLLLGVGVLGAVSTTLNLARAIQVWTDRCEPRPGEVCLAAMHGRSGLAYS